MVRRTPLLVFLVIFAACQGGSSSGSQPQAGPVVREEAASKDSKGVGKAVSPTPAPAAVKTREPVNPREVTISGVLRDELVAGLMLKVPGEWARRPGSSAMRLAEFTLPGPGGDGELVLYRFAGGGGDAKSNVHRWRTQFTRADGAPLTEEDGKVQESVRGSLKITQVDLAGTYVAQVNPMAAERYNDANYRMLALIVEGSGDPYFLKGVGPAATMGLWEPAFKALAETLAVPVDTGSRPVEAGP